MRTADLLRLTASSVTSHRLRAGLTALGIAIGVTAVVLLTSIGEGVHRFVLSEFTQFGTNIISVTPGKTQTFGGSLGALNSVRPLTVDDVDALNRAPYVLAADPVVQGNAEVEFAGRKRRTTVYGVGPRFAEVLRFTVADGTFLPEDDPRAPRALAVLGSRMHSELFGGQGAIGQTIRVGGQRYRVVGVMDSKGTTLGFDLDDTVYVPATLGLALFNRTSLFEAHVLYGEDAPLAEVVDSISAILTARHRSEDFTITTQQQMLDSLGSVLSVLTFAVGALGSISLLVGGVGIFTIMIIGVRERTAEIGLLRALGAEKKQILALFLIEAMFLSAVGGVLGLAVGLGIAGMLDLAVPSLPVSYAPGFIVLAEVLAIVIGLVAGILPAANAARLEPVNALRAE